MRTIVAPLYIRPVAVTDERSLMVTGAVKEVRYRNILAWEGDERFRIILAYLIDMPFDDVTIFYKMIERVGYSPFLEIAAPDELSKIVLTVEQPAKVPCFIIDRLFNAVKQPLEDFRLEIDRLYKRLGTTPDLRGKTELVLDCWRKAHDYGFTHHFTTDENGLPVHIIEGADIRAGALIGLALHLEKRGKFPEPPEVKYCQLPGCNNLINPLLYRGRLYCSDACRRKAADSDRSRLVNRIQTKSARAVKRGRLKEKERRAMLDEIGREKTLEGIKEIAKRYGINPEKEKAGRKSTNKPPPGGAEGQAGVSSSPEGGRSTARRNAGRERKRGDTGKKRRRSENRRPFLGWTPSS